MDNDLKAVLSNWKCWALALGFGLLEGIVVYLILSGGR